MTIDGSVTYRPGVSDGQPLAGRSGKLARLEQIIESVFAAGEKILVFTHFASWGRRLAEHLTEAAATAGICPASPAATACKRSRSRISSWWLWSRTSPLVRRSFSTRLT